MVFARGNSGKRKDNSSDVDLYLSRYVAGEGWTEPRLVSASDSASWDGSPAFSRDGKTLYFASDRPGGSGGLDIYRVNMDASGRFGNAANMGKAINTAGDEMFPLCQKMANFILLLTGIRLGKLDLFVAVRSGGKITVENLGLPYNSSMDDFGLSFDENGNQFFTSNRAAGKGSDDIYFYQAPPKPKEEEVAKNGENPNNKPSSTPESENSKVVNYYLNVNLLTQISDKTVALDSSGIKFLKIEGGIEE
ncbi:MAG: PD40 domain-containing protein [Cytophagaceae bacterium]|nr:PD40 domain-containing protein [Cytophagaceae bacterium]